MVISYFNSVPEDDEVQISPEPIFEVEIPHTSLQVAEDIPHVHEGNLVTHFEVPLHLICDNQTFQLLS